MVRKKYAIKEVKKNESTGNRSCSGEVPILSEQVSIKGAKYEKGKRQIWIILIPLLDVFILNITLIISYVIDLFEHNLPPLPNIPTIDQLGNKAPASFIFTFGMVASSLTTFFVVFFRYKQMSFTRDDCLNTISVIVGYVAALSKLLIGAFQYHPSFRLLHYSTFISYIFFSYAYIGSQVILTYYTKTAFSPAVLYTRLIMAMLMVVFVVLFCIVKLPNYEKLNQPPYNVAQLAQWIYWTLLNIYMLTFMIDFTKIRLSWSIRTSAPVHQLSADDETLSNEYSHELYCADSDSSSPNHAITGRKVYSNFKCEFGIPPELTTEV